LTIVDRHDARMEALNLPPSAHFFELTSLIALANTVSRCHMPFDPPGAAGDCAGRLHIADAGNVVILIFAAATRERRDWILGVPGLFAVRV
jgi:hypothetical protein